MVCEVKLCSRTDWEHPHINNNGHDFLVLSVWPNWSAGQAASYGASGDVCSFGWTCLKRFWFTVYEKCSCRSLSVKSYTGLLFSVFNLHLLQSVAKGFFFSKGILLFRNTALLVLVWVFVPRSSVGNVCNQASVCIQWAGGRQNSVTKVINPSLSWRKGGGSPSSMYMWQQ